MGVDYTASAFYGSKVTTTPEDVDDVEGWLEELLSGLDVGYHRTGCAYSGYDLDWFVCINYHGVSAGYETADFSEVSPEDAHDLLAVVLELGLDYPEWHLSLEVW